MTETDDPMTRLGKWLKGEDLDPVNWGSHYRVSPTSEPYVSGSELVISLENGPTMGLEITRNGRLTSEILELALSACPEIPPVEGIQPILNASVHLYNPGRNSFSTVTFSGNFLPETVTTVRQAVLRHLAARPAGREATRSMQALLGMIHSGLKDDLIGQIDRYTSNEKNQWGLTDCRPKVLMEIFGVPAIRSDKAVLYQSDPGRPTRSLLFNQPDEMLPSFAADILWPDSLGNLRLTRSAWEILKTYALTGQYAPEKSAFFLPVTASRTVKNETTTACGVFLPAKTLAQAAENTVRIINARGNRERIVPGSLNELTFFLQALAMDRNFPDTQSYEPFHADILPVYPQAETPETELYPLPIEIRRPDLQYGYPPAAASVRNTNQGIPAESKPAVPPPQIPPARPDKPAAPPVSKPDQLLSSVPPPETTKKEQPPTAATPVPARPDITSKPPVSAVQPASAIRSEVAAPPARTAPVPDRTLPPVPPKSPPPSPARPPESVKPPETQKPVNLFDALDSHSGPVFRIPSAEIKTTLETAVGPLVAGLGKGTIETRRISDTAIHVVLSLTGNKETKTVEFDLSNDKGPAGVRASNLKTDGLKFVENQGLKLMFGKLPSLLIGQINDRLARRTVQSFSVTSAGLDIRLK